MRPNKRRTINPPPVMIEIKEDDARLARRWKRRSIASQISKISSQQISRVRSCNKAVAQVPEGNYIIIEEDDDDGGNEADVGFRKVSKKFDQAPVKASTGKQVQSDTGNEKRKFRDIGSSAKVGGVDRPTNNSPDSKYSHIHDENRGNTNCSREDGEEAEIAYGFFNVFDSKQYVKECGTSNENGNSNKEDREGVNIGGELFCNGMDSKLLVKECGYNARFVNSCTVNGGTPDIPTTKKTAENGDISKVIKMIATENDFDFDHSHEDDVIGFEATKNSYMVARSTNDGVARGSLDCSDVDECVVGDGNSIASRCMIHDVHDDTHIDNADDMDPDYKIFIEKLRENGNSYFLELLVSDGVMDIISYDTYDERYGGSSAENTMPIGDFQMNNQRNEERDVRSPLRRHKVETQRNLRSVPCRGGKSSVVKEKVQENVINPSLCELKDHLKNMPCPEVPDPINSKSESEQNLAAIDQTYQKFLNGVVEGKFFMFTSENGKEIIYDKDEESSMDSEVNVIDVDPFNDEGHTPFVTSKYIFDERDGCIENSVRKSCLQFREGVIEVLKKPFDEKEYHNLLEEATLKRKIVCHKELRSGPKQFQLPGLGKSYLDQHLDLGEKITSFGNSKPKILNLLRGFFYYLQNVAHNGVFQPWLDPSCLEVLPQ